MTTLLLFMVPVRLKMRRVGQIALFAAIALLLFDRTGSVGHSAFLGGAVRGLVFMPIFSDLDAPRFFNECCGSAGSKAARPALPECRSICRRGNRSLARKDFLAAVWQA